jgi:hypothetical protein
MRRFDSTTAALAAVCLALVGCTASGAVSPQPSASPEHSVQVSSGATAEPRDDPSPRPTRTPTPATTPTPGSSPVAAVDPLPPITYAVIQTNDLRVRSKPGVSDDSIKLTPKLDVGRLLAVVAGPVRASGYDWYLVEPLKEAFSNEKLPFGWVAAASRDGEPWIEPIDIGCPELPTTRPAIDDLDEGGERYLGVGCFSGREVALTGILDSDESWCHQRPAWGVEPVWFDSCINGAYYIWTDDGGAFSPIWEPDIDLSFVPSTYTLSELPVVELTAQFDHPAAATCRSRLDRPELDVPEPDPALIVLKCRNQLVVTSMHVLRDGTQ